MAEDRVLRDPYALVIALAFGIVGGLITAERLQWTAILVGIAIALLVLLAVHLTRSTTLPRRRPKSAPSDGGVVEARDLLQRARSVAAQVQDSRRLLDALRLHRGLVSEADDVDREDLVGDLLNDMRAGTSLLEWASHGQQSSGQLSEDLDVICKTLARTATTVQKELES